MNLEVFSDGSARINCVIDGGYVRLDSRELRELRDQLLEAFPPGLAGPKVEYEVYACGLYGSGWNVRRVEYNTAHKYEYISHSNDKATAERIAKALTEAEGL